MVRRPLSFSPMHQYTRALTRRPGANFSAGQTDAALGAPDIEKALAQHHAYCAALEKCGLEVATLEADERFPDGPFVEDTAIVTEEGALITQPGHESRRGEVESIAEVLSSSDLSCERMDGDARLDGGDVLRVGDHFYIGLSARTNKAGAEQLQAFLRKRGYTSSEVAINNILHLKTGITSPLEGVLLGQKEFLTRPEFSEYEKIQVPDDEAYAANCLSINGTLLFPAGHPKTQEALETKGANILQLEMGEFAKMDGGLTCLSLLW